MRRSVLRSLQRSPRHRRASLVKPVLLAVDLSSSAKVRVVGLARFLESRFITNRDSLVVWNEVRQAPIRLISELWVLLCGLAGSNVKGVVATVNAHSHALVQGDGTLDVLGIDA